jgi:dienelactone hydrolase
LLHEIEIFQRSLSRIDETEVPFTEAVALWCEMSYTPIVEIIRGRDIMPEFPGRTEADLYLWLSRNQEELETRYGHHVLMDEAADDLAERFSERPSAARRVARTVGRIAGGVGELGSRLARNISPNAMDSEDDAVASALLAPVRRVAKTRMQCCFQGTTQAEWDAWSNELGDHLWELLGVGDYPWQPRGLGDLDVEVEESVQVDELVRELVWLNADQDLRLPIYLFRPQGDGGPCPAVVISPGHGTIDQAAGFEDSCQQANALELARAGFITLAVEPRGFGLLDAVDHLQIDAAARLVGRTWYGLLAHDAMRAIDYLHTRPDVDPDRIGVAGIGAGGAVAMYTAALDTRIQAAFVSSYLNKYISASLDQEHCPCETIPGILRYADMGDVAALIVPRPVMFVHGRNDPAGNLGARQSFAIVRHVYHLLGAPRRASMIEPEGMGYVFDNELAIGWFRRWLV